MKTFESLVFCLSLLLIKKLLKYSWVRGFRAFLSLCYYKGRHKTLAMFVGVVALRYLQSVTTHTDIVRVLWLLRRKFFSKDRTFLLGAHSKIDNNFYLLIPMNHNSDNLWRKTIKNLSVDRHLKLIKLQYEHITKNNQLNWVNAVSYSLLVHKLFCSLLLSFCL